MVRKPRKPLTDEQRKLVEENISLVSFVMNMYRSTLCDSESKDIYQQCCLGLIRAAMTYDPAVGRFSTYAIRGIRMYMNCFYKHRRTGSEQININAMRIDKNIGKYEDVNDVTCLDTVAVYDNSEMYARLYAQDILRIVQAIHPSYRQIVDLLMQGESQSEIARIMQCSKQNINRKIKHLQEVIQREYIDCTNSVEG